MPFTHQTNDLLKFSISAMLALFIEESRKIYHFPIMPFLELKLICFNFLVTGSALFDYFQPK